MINTNSAYISDVKYNCSKAKGIITFLMGAAIAASIVYFLYWIAVISESYVLTYTEQYFRPLALLLSFGGDTSVDMYRHASNMLFASLLPLYLAYYGCDKLQDRLIDEFNKKEEALEKQARVKAYCNSLKQYDVIKSYSICLSLDYSAKRTLSESNKEVLNKIIFNKIKTVLNELVPALEIATGEVLIISSSDFIRFDYVYETTLKILAKIKKYADTKYDIETIPSLTTDAHIRNIGAEGIKNNHFQIQSFNFKNRALTTAMFAKKYKHINKNKYAGVPIGEYAAMDSNETKTYELNILSKNLTQTLAGLK